MHSNTIKQPGCPAPCMDSGEARPPHHHQPPNCLEAHTPRSNRLESGPVFSVVARKPMSPTLSRRSSQVTQSSRKPPLQPRNRLHLHTESSQTTPRAQISRIRHRGGDTTGASEMKLASILTAGAELITSGLHPSGVSERPLSTESRATLGEMQAGLPLRTASETMRSVVERHRGVPRGLVPVKETETKKCSPLVQASNAGTTWEVWQK
jgi:hypothetical protein